MFGSLGEPSPVAAWAAGTNSHPVTASTAAATRTLRLRRTKVPSGAGGAPESEPSHIVQLQFDQCQWILPTAWSNAGRQRPYAVGSGCSTVGGSGRTAPRNTV